MMNNDIKYNQINNDIQYLYQTRNIFNFSHFFCLLFGATCESFRFFKMRLLLHTPTPLHGGLINLKRKAT